MMSLAAFVNAPTVCSFSVPVASPAASLASPALALAPFAASFTWSATEPLLLGCVRLVTGQGSSSPARLRTARLAAVERVPGACPHAHHLQPRALPRDDALPAATPVQPPHVPDDSRRAPDPGQRRHPGLDVAQPAP